MDPSETTSTTAPEAPVVPPSAFPEPTPEPITIPPITQAEATPASPAVQSAALSTTINPRLAPQNLDAERSVLGGVLLTNDAMDDVIEHLQADDFYRENHRKIF